jgi:hypothetical protein
MHKKENLFKLGKRNALKRHPVQTRKTNDLDIF